MSESEGERYLLDLVTGVPRPEVVLYPVRLPDGLQESVPCALDVLVDDQPLCGGVVVELWPLGTLEEVHASPQALSQLLVCTVRRMNQSC